MVLDSRISTPLALIGAFFFSFLITLPIKKISIKAQNLDLNSDEPVTAMIKDDEKCIRCGLCAIVCPTDAMTMETFQFEENEISTKNK